MRPFIAQVLAFFLAVAPNVTATPPVCYSGFRGDVSGNRIVSNTDVVIVASQFGAPVTPSNAACDLNGNGIISNTDKSIVQGLVGSTDPVVIPRGVYALIAGTTPIGTGVLSNSDVDGIVLRTGWEDVNPEEDVYDWSYFDTEIPRAVNAGKTVSIRVVDSGTNIPQWVLDACAAASEPTFSFYEQPNQGGNLITQPVFWAPTLLAKKAELMAAFGEKYNSNSNVAMVTCQFAGARNDDWSVPAGTTVDGIPPSGSTERSRWLSAGWTTAKMVDAGNQVVANAMAAFPSKPVGLAIGRVSTALTPEGLDYLAQTVINTARYTYGNRMVATHNNMSERPPVPPPASGSFWEPMYNLRPAVGGQMLWFSYGDSGCRNAANGAPCDAATVLTNSVDKAHAYAWNYLEIYNADVIGLPDVIHYAHELLAP